LDQLMVMGQPTTPTRGLHILLGDLELVNTYWFLVNRALIRINPEKIGALIGPGGKNIKRLVEESGCEINIEDDGTVNIFSVSAEGMKIARDAINGMTAEAEIGKIYKGKVVTVKEFGAFVEFLPGKDGLVHISELANFRVKNTEDIVKVGDEISVKCLGVDEKGRVRLSRKAAMEDRDQEMAPKAWLKISFSKRERPKPFALFLW
jgi:polyribonucleotide nucleotidyltransferase